MLRLSLGCSVAFILTIIFVRPALAQMVGTRGVVEHETPVTTAMPALDPKVAEGYIMIEGSAEIRVRPTDVRMVLAVTSEAETAQKCQQSVDAAIDHLKDSWSKMGIGPEKIVVDFIAVMPRYEWSAAKHGDTDVEVEKKVGYRMQTNVHLAAKGDAEARAALSRALDQGITDVIAFDYWSKDLDDAKIKAREQALKAARSKADMLVGALFPDHPPVINIQEHTAVRYPESLYHSFANVSDEGGGSYFGGWGGTRSVPFIAAYRPRTAYYRGLYGESDVQPRELPMKPEMSVISTIRLYFKSPAADARKKISAGKGE